MYSVGTRKLAAYAPNWESIMSCKNIALIFVATLLSVGGCERRQAPENMEIFDPNFDGPVTSVAVDADPDILADQKKISARIARERELMLEETGVALTPSAPVKKKTSKASSLKKLKQPASTQPTDAKTPATQPAKKASGGNHDPRRKYKPPMRRVLDMAKDLKKGN